MPCPGHTKANRPCRSTILGKNGKCKQHGGAFPSPTAILSAVKQGPRLDASPQLKKFLAAHPEKIVKIQLGRKPIVSTVHKFLNGISLGKFGEKQKELNYDQVYHNYLLITLENGQTYKLEKNQTVIEKPARASDFKNQLFDVPLNGKQLTIRDMVANASAGHEADFYKYRADSNNCQRFTRDMIEKNGLLDDDAKHFELQDAKQLVGTLPGEHLIPNTITDAAATANRILEGGRVGKGFTMVKGTTKSKDWGPILPFGY